jgi:hypothetical protein
MSALPQSRDSEIDSGFFRNYGAIEPADRKDGGRSGQHRIGFVSAVFIIFNGVVGAG